MILPKVRQQFVFRPRHFSMALGIRTKVMGIINITPDSFSRDGCLTTNKKNFTQKAVALATSMIKAGAEILDIGGESSRPGARPISAEEEAQRILPTIKLLAKKKIILSVDTYKSLVAQHALDAGASVINNIQGTPPEKSLLKMIARYKAGVVLMHMRGTPQTMQKNIHYHRLMNEIIAELRKSIEKCLEIGIKSDKIIIDPGIGFGKTAEHNLEILNRLSEFKVLRRPLLIGTSRKSFIGKVLGKESQDRIRGTAATVCAGILHGAHIVRVHDVAEIMDTVKMSDAIINQETA